MDTFMDIMNKRFLRPALASTLLVAGLAGCTPTEAIFSPAAPFQRTAVAGSAEVDLVRMSYALTDALIAELRKGHPLFDPKVPILVASFVNRSRLNSTSELGLLMADHVASRMTQQGYTVVEPKLRQDFSIREEEGEFLLSRDIERLHQESGAYAAVIGSYTETLYHVDFTTKIVGIRNRKVLASVDVKLPLGQTSRDLLSETGGGTPLEVVDQ